MIRHPANKRHTPGATGILPVQCARPSLYARVYGTGNSSTSARGKGGQADHGTRGAPEALATRQWHTHGSTRGGFTLIEMLIVIGIILLLMALSLQVYTNLITTARGKATRATITKIDGLIRERLRAFDIAFGEGRFDGEISGQTVELGKALAEAIVRKEQLRNTFPQHFGETSPLIAEMTDPDITGYVVGKNTPVTESSELLYYILTQANVLGVSPVGTDAFQSSETADTDGDGLLEFVDSWGQPLQFYRWPTRLIRPDADGDGTADVINNNLVLLLLGGLHNDILSQDPDDPFGAFADSAATETNYHTPDTYHTPLVISAGPDGQLGLFEPHDVANFGHLAQPLPGLPTTDPLNSVLNDNITSHQQGGSN